MQLCVDSALLPHVILNGGFIARSADGVDVKAGGPESATPENLPNLGMTIKELSCREALDDSGNFCRREHGNGLEQEMDVILVCPDFNEGDFVVLGDGPADIFQGFLDWLCKHLLPALNRANEVIEEKGDIVGLSLMLGHAGMLPA